MEEHELKKEHISDSDLIDLILEEKNNFSFLVERYELKLGRYIQRITNIPVQDRQDLLQNIFLKVYLNIRSFDPGFSMDAWMYRIARNEVIDFSRKKKSLKNKPLIDLDDEFFSLFQDSFDILDTHYQKEDREKITNTFNKMRSKYREVLYLKYIEMYSYRDISDILKKPESNVSTMIHRAKKEFKKYFNEL